MTTALIGTFEKGPVCRPMPLIHVEPIHMKPGCKGWCHLCHRKVARLARMTIHGRPSMTVCAEGECQLHFRVKYALEHGD